MPTKDSYGQTHHLPQLLADLAQQDMDDAPDRAVAPSRAFKASILIAIAVVAGIAVVAMGNPVSLLAEMSASLIGNSGPPSAPEIQFAAAAPPVPSAADARALTPTANDAPGRVEIAASEPAGQEGAEKTESPSEILFRQFQAWAAARDTQAQGEPVRPVADAPAQAAQNAPAPAAKNVRGPYPQVQKRRQVQSAQNARAEERAREARRQVRRAQSPRADRSRALDARAQDQSVQNTEAPSFLPGFGQRN